VEKRRSFRQEEYGRGGEEDSGGGDGGANSSSARPGQSERQHSESRDRDRRLGRCELKKIEIIHRGGVVESLQPRHRTRVTWESGRGVRRSVAVPTTPRQSATARALVQVSFT
jgi:hypothetical protein